MRWFFLLLPFFELLTLIWLLEQIGVFTSLAYGFVTLFLGLAIVRAQGMEITARLRSAQGQMLVGQRLGAELAVGLAGFLLMMPGLLTDTLALLLLIPPLRRRLGALAGALFSAWQRGNAARPGTRGPSARGGAGASAERPVETIEGEFQRLADD